MKEPLEQYGVHVVAHRPRPRNGVYLDASFRSHQRRRWLERLGLLAVGLTVLASILLVLAALIGLIWILLAIGRAVGARA